METSFEWLWLRGMASVLLLEGCWFDSPGLHVEVSLGKILNPKCKSICVIDIMQH